MGGNKSSLLRPLQIVEGKFGKLGHLLQFPVNGFSPKRAKQLPRPETGYVLSIWKN